MSVTNIVLDATMLDTFLSCPAKFNYRFNLNKQQVGDKAAPLDKGDLIHKGLERYFLTLKETKNWDAAFESAKIGIDLAATESDLDPTEISFLKKVLIENVSYWKSKDLYFEILAVERPFAYILYEDEHIRITMIGKIDLLVNEGNYHNLPYDHKTYSRDFPIRRKMNQFCNYAFALNSSYVFANRIGLQTSLPAEKKYKRVPLNYDRQFLEQWKQNVVKWCYFYVECALDKSWPLNDTSCDKYNRLCEYYDICDTSGEENKVYKLMTNFKDSEKWDVSKSLGLSVNK